MKFLNNYRNVYGKSSAKREYHNENVFLQVDRALSKLITLLISNKKEFNHLFKSRFQRFAHKCFDKLLYRIQGGIERNKYANFHQFIYSRSRDIA